MKKKLTSEERAAKVHEAMTEYYVASSLIDIKRQINEIKRANRKLDLYVDYVIRLIRPDLKEKKSE